MKSCLYFYKEKEIGNIAQLDDFLISKQKYYSKLGDKVFQTNANIASILTEASNKNKEIARKWNIAKRVYAGEEELIKLNRPFVGVTEFLGGQRNAETGKLYYPEFREGEYWASRFHAWGNGKKATLLNNSNGFTQDEIDLFFDGDESKITAISVGDFVKWKNDKGEYYDEFGSDEQKLLREKMTHKWESQARLGTEIHNVLEAYFSSSSSRQDLLDSGNRMQIGNFISGLRKTYEAEILKDNKLVKQTISKISEDTTDEKVYQILEYAKQLRTKLISDYGTNLSFYPEFTLSADLNKEFEGRTDLKIAGRVDLIVVDEEGFPHIVDYKTSPKHYEEYAGAKKLAFTYQLATYKRMLQRLGLNTEKTDLVVAPITMDNFHLEGDHWMYDSVSIGAISTEILHTLNEQANSEKLIKNLNEYIEAPVVMATAEHIISNVKEAFDKWFPKYGSKHLKTDQEIKEMIEKQGGFKKDTNTNEYKFTPKGWSKAIVAKSEVELYNKVKQEFSVSKERVINKTQSIIKAIKKAKKEGSIQLSRNTDEWVINKLSKYTGDNWEILENDAAEAASKFGVILFYNQETDIIEVIKIASGDLRAVNSWGRNRTNLTGAHELDLAEDSKSDSLALKAANGNIELMEAMLVLNNIQFNRTVQIGRIDVISPFSEVAQGLTATNKELKYNWDKLMKLKPLNQVNQFGKGTIKMLTKTEQCYQEFQEILSRLHKNNSKLLNDYREFEPVLEQLFAYMPTNVEATISKLMELRSILENDKHRMGKTLDNDGNSRHSGLKDYDQDYDRNLYQLVSAAILELRNFNIRQNIKDHDPYLESVHILRDGISGNNLDNAGNFGNRLLNQITSLALEGYQNARDEAFRKLNELRQKTEKLKNDTGFSGLLEHTIGNQASLFNGMTEYTQDGDLRFVNPWKNNKLSPQQQEYLKFAILELNKNAHPTWTEAQIQDKIQSDDITFFQVPLIDADIASRINTDGWLGFVKNTFKCFSSWSKFKQSLKDLQSNFLGNDVEQQITKKSEIFQVVNLMNVGNDIDRKRIIKDKISAYGEGFFERDIEKILAAQTWAYATQRALEDRMVLLKSAYITLNVMGNDQNQTFKEDEEFFKKFVANRINHQSIDDEKLKPLKGAVGIMQRAVSWMALAFAPVQFSGQSLEGIWKACKLIITKPDGTETFTAKNMTDAAKQVYSELFHFSDIPTVSGAVNAQYGINDMDNSSFADNNTSNRHGLFNFFGRFAYKFASRPDFYNRMTIFVAQMKKDGSWEAHSVNKQTGELIYDYTKDKRFAAWANDKEGKNGKTEEWQKAKAMYYTVARQLVQEGARNKDGSLFTVEQPLPKAYSNKESEAKKAVGDNMYGYYDSTKKSLFQSMFLGGLLFQMKTYWSSKKNQYFAPGGIKAQGKWVQLEAEAIDPETNEVKLDSNGKPIIEKYYYPKTETGEVDLEGTPVPESDPNCSKMPFMQWQGKFEEGVIVTIGNFLNELRNTGSWKQAVDSMFGLNSDPELRKVYQANIKLFFSDLIMWILIGGAAVALSGDWADDEIKKAKESGHMRDAISATFADLAYRTIRYSSNDFAWWKSIFDISMDWNPMAISYLTKEFSYIGDMLTGDATFSDTVVKSFTATRQIRPIFDCLQSE